MKRKTQLVGVAKQMKELLEAHAQGNVEAGNAAFALADELARKLAGSNFDTLLESYVKHGYRPTIRPDLGVEHYALALAYDYAQAVRGVKVTSYPGSSDYYLGLAS